MMDRARLTFLVMLLSLTVATGCTGKEAGADAPIDASSAKGDGSGADSGTAAGGAEPHWASFTSPAPGDMPLTPYFEVIDREQDFIDSKEDTRAEWVDQLEEHTAACMSEAGFKYYPTAMRTTADLSATKAARAEEGKLATQRLPVPALPDQRDQVEAAGYGQYWMSYQEANREPEADSAPDPNAEYLESLSEQGQEQYAEALGEGYGIWGGDFMPAIGLALEMTKQGCTTDALRQIPDPGTDYVPATDSFEDLIFGGMTMIQYDTDQDPKTLALNREWMTCANHAGLDVREEVLTGDGGGTSTESGPITAFRMAISTSADGL
ncbi:MAG: hypothetical protein LBK95_06965, partial [Bifidobacteriaceae bacterium]|nr:hypothetical protein [Bifidobacteriaceae bacterium]